MKTISPAWQAEAELQYRRQDNDNGNIFSLPLAQSVRGWLYYQPAPHWVIGFSPFAWFHNYALVSKPADEQKNWNEYRVQLYAEHRTVLGEKLSLYSRAGFEPITQAREGNKNFVRFRWREQVSRGIGGKTLLMAGGELFLNSFYSTKMPFYNQSRAYATIQQRLSGKLAVEGTYMFQHIQANTNRIFLKSHDLVVTARLNL